MIRTTAVLTALLLAGPMLSDEARAQADPPRAVLTGVALDTLDLSTPEGRRALLRSRPFEPREIPTFRGQRTLFYGTRPTQVEEGSQVLLVPPSEVPALSPSTFHSAGWLVAPDESIASIGRVRSFAGGQDTRVARTTVFPYDELRLNLDASVRVQPGDSILVVRDGRRVVEIGQAMIPTGVLEVVRVDESGVVARLVREFSKVELGNRVFPMRTFPLRPGVYPAETPSRFSANVLAFEEWKELYLPGDRFFIDAGDSDGLRIGDEFEALAGESAGWSGTSVGDFQVVGLRDETATLRIIESRHPSAIRPGMIVTLVRAMP